MLSVGSSSYCPDLVVGGEVREDGVRLGWEADGTRGINVICRVLWVLMSKVVS